MKEKFFLLKKNCVLVEGALRGALYNLNTGNVYSIDENALKLLKGCFKQRLSVVDSLLASNIDLPKTEVIKYLKLLQDMEIGYFCQEAKKEQIPIPESTKGLLKFLWVELTSRCNLRCLHCYNASGEKKEKARNPRNLTLKQWQKIMFVAKNLGCQRVQFTGGEPLLMKKMLRELISCAKSLHYNFIEVFTNATLLTNFDIEFFKKNNVHVAVSLYSSQAKIHDEITQLVGSFKTTLTNLKKLKASKIPLRVSVIIMKNNEDSIKETLCFIKNDIGITKIKCDVIRPIGRGSKPELIPQKSKKPLVTQGPKFRKIHRKMFWLRHDGHNCYMDHLCISPKGDVFPCVMERTIKLGNVKKTPLSGLWKSCYVLKIRGLSKDKIEVCQDCEYRYACFDCRARVKQQTNNLYSKPTACQYNPYSGKWQKK